jgi:hypothetical protein
MSFKILFGVDIDKIDAIPDCDLVFFDDYLGHDHDNNGWTKFAQLMENSQANAVVEYADSYEIPKHLQSRVICLPLQPYFTSFALSRLIPAEPWIPKHSAFNFCINKVRDNRAWLIRELARRKILTDTYSIHWSTYPEYPNRYWMSDTSEKFDGNINNNQTTNIEVYKNFLQHKVYEPSYISLITEPAWQHRAVTITEKTMFAFEAGTVPIWIGGVSTPRAMKNLGFDIFEDIVDHSYQHMHTNELRMSKAIELNIDLLTDVEKLQDFFVGNQTRFEQNRAHLRSNNWFYYHLRRQLARVNWPQSQVIDIAQNLLLEHNYQWSKL